jgi:hypothetical protein
MAVETCSAARSSRSTSSPGGLQHPALPALLLPGLFPRRDHHRQAGARLRGPGARDPGILGLRPRLPRGVRVEARAQAPHRRRRLDRTLPCTISRYFMIWLASARYSLVRAMMFRGDLFIWSTGRAALDLRQRRRDRRDLQPHQDRRRLEPVRDAAPRRDLDADPALPDGFLLERDLRDGAQRAQRALRLRRSPSRGTRSSWRRPGSWSSTGCSTRSSPGAWWSIRPGSSASIPARARSRSTGAWWPAASSSTTVPSSWRCPLLLDHELAGRRGKLLHLMEFSRLPREAFKGLASTIFVWVLPVVVVSNAPARELLHGFQPSWAARALRGDRRLVRARGLRVPARTQALHERKL